jgi:hypothetical protein
MEVSVEKNPTEIDKVILEVQKKIYGEREEKLTPLEINRLFQSQITPEFNLIIYKALEKKAIDPDNSMLHLIPKTKTKEFLVPLALCIRFGADTNMYLNIPKLGTVHILGYIYNILGNNPAIDQDLLDIIVIMLMAKGSRPSLPMFDKRAGEIRSEMNIGYDTILNKLSVGDASEISKIVDNNSSTSISIILDIPELATRPYVEKDFCLSVKFFSNYVIDKIPIPTTKIIMDYKSLEDTVHNFNYKAFAKLLNKGQSPSYLMINKLIIGIRDRKKSGKIIVSQELERMLLDAIDSGTQLDVDQMNIVGIIGKDLLDAVNRKYEQPYWKKICKIPNRKILPAELKHLAVSLNIDPTMNHAGICQTIDKLSKSDKESLKEAARKRQQLRLTSDLSNMNEFLGEKPPILTCRNVGTMPHNPMDYNDINLAYYRDDQLAVWCFTSDTFAELVETKTNPYSSAPLPTSFITQLQYQIDVLKKLGIDAGRGEIGIYTSKIPQTFSVAIDNLENKDIINEKSSSKAVDAFVQLASMNSISPETIKNLTKKRMIYALRSINYEVDLTQLSTGHALVTTARVVNYINRNDQDSIPSFFDSLNTFGQ